MKNRIIKFRAWHKEEKKMYDVWSVDRAEVSVLTNSPNTYGMQEWKSFSTGMQAKYSLEHDYWVSIPIKYVELMQFTGLLDKNGKEIYEGDILRWEDWQQEETVDPDYYLIEWQSPSFTWQCYRGGKKLDMYEPLRDTNEFEVIANIFENPDYSLPTIQRGRQGGKE